MTLFLQISLTLGLLVYLAALFAMDFRLNKSLIIPAVLLMSGGAIFGGVSSMQGLSAGASNVGQGMQALGNRWQNWQQERHEAAELEAWKQQNARIERQARLEVQREQQQRQARLRALAMQRKKALRRAQIQQQRQEQARRRAAIRKQEDGIGWIKTLFPKTTTRKRTTGPIYGCDSNGNCVKGPDALGWKNQPWAN